MATQTWTSSTRFSLAYEAAPEACWFALHTKARHEKSVDALLRAKNFQSFLPTITKVQRWSDRNQKVEFPLFPSYSFVQVPPNAQNFVAVLRTPGVVRIVGAGCEPLAVPEKQIEDIRSLLNQKVPFWEHPFLTAGQRVRVRGGCLEGIEGILTEVKANRILVISADPIQRSIAVSVEDYEVEPI
jgi:transcription antitermination factor NusG